ncbi:MAG: MATE family efflux transporter [Lachnospiraceae bacterium]|nr:MATE family efflux transporter [Lachnospiraceae bacterium]
MKLYDKKQIDWNNLLFDNRALFLLLLPIIIEQLLNSLMGMVDTMMVSTVGSEAISAVSLVDSINNLVIQIFSAMASGAAIICSQYIGSGNEKESNKAARQVVLTVLVISLAIMSFCILGGERLLRLVFGAVEEPVMENAIIYFIITVISYPFLALFSAGAAFYRASGNAKFPMKVSVVSNVLNIAGNAMFIYVFHWGAAGAALSTLLSRVFCTTVIFYCLRKPKQIIVVKDYLKIRPDMSLIVKIMAIGIPSGIENGMFQFGKLAIQSTVSTMGTVAIAAQAMTNILENVNGVFGIGVGIGLMTVAGQCIGAGRKEETKYYIVKLTKIAWVGIFASCLFVLAITKPVTWLAGMEPKAAAMCFEMVTAITIAKPLFWVGSFVIAYGLRAAGDVKFSMMVSVITMWGCRVALCIFLVKVFHFGPMAVWIGMFADWGIRSVIFILRFLSGKWIHADFLTKK